MKKICLSVTLAFLIAVSISGCTNKKQTEKVNLRLWGPMHNVMSNFIMDNSETELYKELERRTGVHIEFIHPPEGQVYENLSIMLAGGDLPDLIEYNWINFSGGPSKALRDGYIIKLNDIMKKDAPNLSEYLSEHPDVDKMVKTDEGLYYGFPFIRGGDELTVYYGPALRGDWLRKLGLERPETIDEWTNVLRQFKTIEGCKYPLTYERGIETAKVFYGFHGAFGLNKGFYVDNGVVKYGEIQPAYKEYLRTMNKWYNEGLLDPAVAVNDLKSVDNKILNGESGALFTYTGNGIGKYHDMIKNKNPDFELVAAKYPSLIKGELSAVGQRDELYTPSYSTAITSKCKNVDAAAKWLDYNYGDEGHILMNFGIEGKSFVKQGDNYIYTDEITNNPNGGMAQMLGIYTRVAYGGPFVQDKNYIMQYLSTPAQKEAISIWAQTKASEHNLPLVTPTPEESSELARIMNDITVYTDEMVFKFINGQQSFDDFDSFVDTIKRMNIDRAIEIQQNALERYNNRP